MGHTDRQTPDRSIHFPLDAAVARIISYAPHTTDNQPASAE